MSWDSSGYDKVVTGSVPIEGTGLWWSDVSGLSVESDPPPRDTTGRRLERGVSTLVYVCVCVCMSK